MQIEKSFVIRAPLAAVWEFLTDPHRVVRCLPGAAITEQVDEQTWAGTITVKVGPVAASYKGKVRFERLDPATHTAEIVASGQDVRGKGGADMRMTSRLTGRSAGETEVAATSQVNVTGILAQFGRGMIQDVSDQMFGKFTAAMRSELESAAGGGDGGPGGTPPAARSEIEPAAPPVDVVSLGAGVLGRAAVRGLRRPVIWAVAAAVLALVVYWIWLRSL
jgi:carbon monoxide dehydrogenase subunit G